MNNDERMIELSKTKLLLLIVGALIFVALGIWMYQLDPAWIEAQRRFNSPVIVHGSASSQLCSLGPVARQESRNSSRRNRAWY